MVILTKRRKFILSSVILSAGMLLLQSGFFPDRYLAIGILCLMSVPLTLWSLKEALKGSIWLMSWVLPLLFTVGVGFFYFLLPTNFYTGLPIIIFYLLGTYVIFLSENIFSVAAIRTIQLYRSSMAVSFLLSLVISFLLYDTIFSFRFPFYINGLVLWLFSFLIFLHGCWVVTLEEKISRRLLLYSLVLSLGIGEAGLALSFWPVSVTLGSVFLTSVVYVSLGLAQARLSDRLFKGTIREYLVVGAAVFLVLLFYTNWG